MIDGQVDAKRRKKFFKAIVKVKGGFQAKDCTSIITMIQADANTLRECVRTANQLERTREVKRLAKPSPSSWITARNHSKRLYEMLQSTFSASCTSHKHTAQVRLKAPSKKQAGYTADDAIPFSFMLQHASSEDGDLPWEYRHVHFIPFVSE